MSDIYTRFKAGAAEALLGAFQGRWLASARDLHLSQRDTLCVRRKTGLLLIWELVL